jgi:cell division protein FtsW
MKNRTKLLILIFLFLLFGIFMIGDVSLLEAERSFGDRLYFIKHHLIWISIGLGLMIVFSAIRYQFLANISFCFYLLSIILLVAVLIPGIGVNVYGAQRWIDLNFIRFQPSEIVKIFILIYLSSLLVKKSVNIGQLFLILIPPVGLILAQPDFATAAIIVASGLTVYFFSGESIKKIIVPCSIFLFL